MFDKLLAAALMLGTAAGVSAQTRWDFAYSGFHYQEGDIFVPSARIDGSFEGSDANGDGILQRQEVTSFVVDTLEYVNNPDGCRVSSCSLLDFSYGIRSGKLDFVSTWTYSDDFNYSVGRIETGKFSLVEGFNGSGEWSQSVYSWTEQTAFWINPAPVPEPASMVLLAAGVLVVGVWRRRGLAGS